MQLIFIVEANKDSQSDYLYISETLKKYYNTLGHKMTPIYLNGKGNYNKKKTEIGRNISKYSGTTHIFMCYDIDNPNKQAYELNPLIEDYAKENGYELIWFYEDIEQVYLGESVPNNVKAIKAKQFVAHNAIKEVQEISLIQKEISRKKSSNILVVLDKWLPRKH